MDNFFNNEKLFMPSKQTCVCLTHSAYTSYVQPNLFTETKIMSLS